MTTAAEDHPTVFAGLPLSSWTFAIRIWLAVVVALYVGFWLELESASSAAVTVAILALPSRGQVIEKAVFRLIATVVGVTASIVIVGLFSQTDALLLAAFAVWLAACVYAVGLLDGNRAYAAALSGYTVALIAVQQMDNPQHVFESSMARGAAITVGILAITVVNDLLVAPNHHPQLMAQLAGLHRQVISHAQRILRGETVPANAAAGLLRDIVAMRPEIASLASELSSGPARGAAARNLMVGLVAELFAARAVEMLCAKARLPLREHVVAQIERDLGVAGSSPEAMLPEHEIENSDLLAASLSWSENYLIRTDTEVRRNLGDLMEGRLPTNVWRAPLYRSHRIAVKAGVRAAVWFLIVAAIFAASGWPTTEVALQFIPIIVGLGATTPNPRAFTIIAVVSAPIACLMTGILEFVVLNGATAFPLLAISLAPFMIGVTLLMTLPNRFLSASGRLSIIFILAILAPSNPQTYNPETFLFSVLFIVVATVLLLGAQILIPPVSNEYIKEWLYASARNDLERLPSRRKQKFAPEEAMFRDSSRIARILAAAGNGPKHGGTMDEVMAAFDRAAMLRICDAELSSLAEGPLRAQVGTAYDALAARDAESMIASARAMHQAQFVTGVSTIAASAALVLASAAFARKTSRPNEFAVSGSL